MWSTRIYDTLSGALVRSLPASSRSGSKKVNGVGQGEHVFQLRDAATAPPSMAAARAQWWDTFDPWRRTVVQCWDGVPFYAGLIQRLEFDDDSGALTVASSEVRSIFNRRLAQGIGGWTPEGTFTISARSLHSIAKAIVYRGVSEYGGRWRLPFVYPADIGGSASREFRYWAFQTIEDMLTEAQDTEGGPDVALEPELDDQGRLRWRLLLGTPKIQGARHEFVKVANRKQVVDGSQMLTGVLAVGAGEERDTLVGFGNEPFVPSEIPFLDSTRQFKALDSQGAVDAMGRSVVRAQRNPTKQDTFDVVATGDLPTRLRLGDTIAAWSAGNEWRAPGWFEQTLIGITGEGPTLSLELQ